MTREEAERLANRMSRLQTLVNVKKTLIELLNREIAEEAKG